MNTDALKRRLQSLFSDGLVAIIGSGLSCAEGLPGMGALASRLKGEVPGLIGGADGAAWAEVAARLDAGMGLEAALHEVAVSADLEASIVESTSKYILAEEAKVLTECLNAGRTLRFARLLPHLCPTNPKRVEVVTTNYDRLVEFAVESVGWGVDTGFVGRLWGRHIPTESDKSFARAVTQQHKGKAFKLQYRDRVRLYKPHGSLDWFDSPQGPLCSALPMTAPRLLITPGVGKYRLGYNPPFDSHREGANTAVDKAVAFLCIGYGFNDDHLQTHLTPRLKAGVPAVLLTRSLSGAAQAVIQASANTIALIHHDHPVGTRVVTQQGHEVIPGVAWWDLERFIKGVLEP